MLHVEEISARILSIGSRAQPENIDAGPSSVKHVRPTLASVLHASNPGRYSLMTKRFLKKIYAHRYGPEKPLPSVTADTIIHLQWQYPGFDQLQVTEHLVLENAPYDVILRQQDWERPIRTWLLQKYTVQQLRQLRVLPPLKDGETDGETSGEDSQQVQDQDEPQGEHRTDWGSNSHASITPTERSEGTYESSDGGYPPSTTTASEPTSPVTNGQERVYELRQRHSHLKEGREAAEKTPEVDSQHRDINTSPKRATPRNVTKINRPPSKDDHVPRSNSLSGDDVLVKEKMGKRSPRLRSTRRRKY